MSSMTSLSVEAVADQYLLAGLYPFDGDFVAPPSIPQEMQPGDGEDAAAAAVHAPAGKRPMLSSPRTLDTPEGEACPTKTATPLPNSTKKRKRQQRHSRSVSVDAVAIPGNTDNDSGMNGSGTSSIALLGLQQSDGSALSRVRSLSILLTGPEEKKGASSSAAVAAASSETAGDQSPSPLDDLPYPLDERVATSPHGDVLPSLVLGRIVTNVVAGHNAVLFSLHGGAKPRPASSREWATEYMVPSLLHTLFAALKAQTEHHYGVGVSVSLLKHDLAHDLLRPNGQSAHIVVTGFPLLGTTLTTSSVQAVATAAEGASVVMGAIAAMTADDYAKGCVLTNILVKQKVLDPTTGEQRDAILSSLFCLSANTQVCREMVLLRVLPATLALLQSALRAPCQLCFCLHNAHMSHAEARLALEVQETVRQVTTPPSPGGSVRPFLKHIKQRYKYLYTRMEEAKARVAESRVAWRRYTMPRMEHPITTKMIDKEAAFQHEMHAAYAKDKMLYKRLSFALHAMAAIAKCGEQVLVTPVTEIPRPFLVTYHYLDPDWFRVPQDTQRLHATFAGQSENGVNEISDESILNGKKRRKYPFSYRRSVPVLSVLDHWKTQTPRVNLFAGDYSCSSQGILPLFRTGDSAVRHFFFPGDDAAPAPAGDRIVSSVLVEDADRGEAAAGVPAAVTVADKSVKVLARLRSKRPRTLVQFHVDEAVTRPAWSFAGGAGGAVAPPPPAVREALASFRQGHNVRLMCMAGASAQSSSTARLLRCPVWHALARMVDDTFRPSTAASKERRREGAPRCRLYVSVVQILSSRFVHDHLRLPPPPPESGDEPAEEGKDDVALPFRSAWTPAGPVVQGARYQEIAAGADVMKLLRTLPGRVEARGTTQTHLVVSFLQHQTTAAAGGDRSLDVADGTAIFAQLSVHMTTNLSLFNCLYMPAFVQPFHPQNLFHVSFCDRLVLLVDLAADHEAEAYHILRQQAQLCQSTRVALYHRVWDMHRYTAYLRERALAMRAALAKRHHQPSDHATEAASDGAPAASDLFPPPPPAAPVLGSVLSGTAVDYECLSSTLRQVERMLSLAMELTDTQPAPNGPKALSFDSVGTYAVTDPPPLFERHVTAAPTGTSLEASVSLCSSSRSEPDTPAAGDGEGAGAAAAAHGLVPTREPQPVSRAAPATVHTAAPAVVSPGRMRPIPTAFSPVKPKADRSPPVPPQPVPPPPMRNRVDILLPTPTSPSKQWVELSSPASASSARPKTAQPLATLPPPASPPARRLPSHSLSPGTPQPPLLGAERKVALSMSPCGAARVTPTSAAATHVRGGVPPHHERLPQPPAKKLPTLVQRLRMLDEACEPSGSSQHRHRKESHQDKGRDREGARTPSGAQSRNGGGILPSVAPSLSTGNIPRDAEADKNAVEYARLR
ncbi:hypothetical protein STCU_11314 [Strigomonas culicis]|uniref:Uncharacterized protein n=1 Tax=Strigomonas culicis TaxID=28005 RepID=S9V0R1_9TRYP|nr:hypothetical protein STCU_11314 [Strigomonas culicis]|eukprot:EPY16395.1 hypothetical protein STCU_11314 [Strigomonas culicis]